jgi:hypothetical protein
MDNNTQEKLADIESRLNNLEHDGSGIIGIALLTVAAGVSAWVITGKIIDRKVAKKIKKQEKENKKKEK